MTEMEKRILPAIMACHLAPVAFSILTVPVGIESSAKAPSLPADRFASVVPVFSVSRRAPSELNFGRAILLLLSFPLDAQRCKAVGNGMAS